MSAIEAEATESQDPDRILAGSFAAVEILARALRVPDARLQPTLDAIVAQAVAAHPAARDAGLILLRGGRLEPQAVTGQAPQELDLRQQAEGDGPCYATAATQTMTFIRDTREDTRWPGFCAEAQARQVASILCAPLWVSDRTLGALTLFAAEPDAFGSESRRSIETFAALAALALAEAQRTEQLRSAIISRDFIGQAKGILMERFGIDADTAFATLTRLSQGANLKLIDLARSIADTRQIPELPRELPGK